MAEADHSQSVDPEARALIERYPKVYSDRKFWKKIWRWAKRAGRLVIKHALTLYYCSKDEDTPEWVRVLIWGALGYFIWPLDAFPDMLPGGFTDDLGILLLLIVQLPKYIKPEHYQQACERMKEWFGEEENGSEGGAQPA